MPTTILFAAEQAVLPLAVRMPLSVMNFLEFAVWGAWWVVLGNYLNSLNFSRQHIGRIYATMSLGSIISPMFIGTIADRYFASEQLMGVLHLVGAVLLYTLARIKMHTTFYWVALLYALVYSPTLALSNSVIFENTASLEFPSIRVLGTIGWILAGLSLRLFIRPGQQVNNTPILLAAALSLVLGVFSFFLPHTPPGAAGSGATAEATVDAAGTVTAIKVTAGGAGYQRPPAITLAGGGGKGAQAKATLSADGAVESIEVVQGGSEYAAAPSVLFPEPGIPFLKALKLVEDRSFAIFFGVSFLITIALAFYYSFTALYLEQGVGVQPENVAPMMTIGQWVEIIFMLTLSWFIEHWGIKAVLALGMAAWAIRYGIFAAMPPLGIVLIGIGLHGICFDFFFAAGMIHTANAASPDIAASAQSLFAVLTYGLGMYLGTEASGWLNQIFTRHEVDPATGQAVHHTDWRKFWLVPCVGATLSLVLFWWLFQLG